MLKDRIENLESILAATSEPSKAELDLILSKAATLKGLSLEETATLLKTTDPDLRASIRSAANDLKKQVFGDRVVLFAPLYLTNYCVNGCLYCGFRASEPGEDGGSRRALSIDEVVKECASLVERGFKRVLFVLGEDPTRGVDYIIDCVKAAYKETGIRIVHVNAPPMTIDEFRALKGAGIGVYQSFQETYHRETYERVHPRGPKSDYINRIDVMDRALEAGFEDIGIGTLLGLYDWRFDVLATVAHSNHLFEKFNTHAHTISIPRLRPAEGSSMEGISFDVTDDDLKLIVSIYRLAVPSAGLVATTRESPSLRTELLSCGASQVSAASSTSPGGYSKNKTDVALEQFSTADLRTLEEVMQAIIEAGGLPSLCTACYRVGRVGADFTHRTTEGAMEKYCEANAILTFSEYLLDQNENGTGAKFREALDSALLKITDDSIRESLLKKLKELEGGSRDLYF